MIEAKQEEKIRKEKKQERKKQKEAYTVERRVFQQLVIKLLCR